VFELDDGLDFMSGSEIWAPSAEQISPSMIDRLLDERDLFRLDRILLAENAPAPSVRRRNARRAMVINWVAMRTIRPAPHVARINGLRPHWRCPEPVAHYNIAP